MGRVVLFLSRNIDLFSFGTTRLPYSAPQERDIVRDIVSQEIEVSETWSFWKQSQTTIDTK